MSKNLIAGIAEIAGTNLYHSLYGAEFTPQGDTYAMPRIKERIRESLEKFFKMYPVHHPLVEGDIVQFGDEWHNPNAQTEKDAWRPVWKDWEGRPVGRAHSDHQYRRPLLQQPIEVTNDPIPSEIIHEEDPTTAAEGSIETTTQTQGEVQPG